MDFSGDIGRFQRALAGSHDASVRRAAVFEALAPRTGEAVLEIGCGGGAYVRDMALAVGSGGRACGIDISADQLESARALCADAPAAELLEASALDLPFEDGTFDAAYSVQALEYIEAVDEALAEAGRVLKPGGRLVHLATLWDSVVFSTGEEDLMARILGTWQTAHCPYPDLPASMPGRLRGVGFVGVEQTPLPLLTTSNHEHSFIYWASQVFAVFAVGQDAVSASEAQAWLADLRRLDAQGAFFFSAMTVITKARKPG